MYYVISRRKKLSNNFFVPKLYWIAPKYAGSIKDVGALIVHAKPSNKEATLWFWCKLK